MNVTYPVVDDEILDFCRDKRAVLLVEEGQPDYIEQNLNAILRRNGVDTALHGKGMLPVAGEYTSAAVTTGIAEFLRLVLPDAIQHEPALLRDRSDPASPFAPRVAAEVVQARRPGLCTGCPERPIFSGMKLAERETGEHHVSADIGCHLFAINAPFELGATTMGYGLGSAGAAALSAPGRRAAHGRVHGRRRLLAQRPDQRRRQRRVQQVRPAARGRRQRLRRRDRRPGPPLLPGRQPDALDPAPDREGGPRRRRRVGEDDRRHLRRRPRSATRSSRRSRPRRPGPKVSSCRASASSTASAGSSRRCARRSRRASASPASASASTPRRAPATTPASASPAARR